MNLYLCVCVCAHIGANERDISLESIVDGVCHQGEIKCVFLFRNN